MFFNLTIFLAISSISLSFVVSLIVDLDKIGTKFVVAKGGIGGKGNSFYKMSGNCSWDWLIGMAQSKQNLMALQPLICLIIQTKYILMCYEISPKKL